MKIDWVMQANSMPSIEKNRASFPYSPSSHLFSPIINAKTPKNYYHLHKVQIDPKSELLNVSLAVPCSLLQTTAGSVHVQEVFDTICDSNFDAQLFSF